MARRAAGLRVLMTADAVGGVWSYSVALASALAERGHSVHLVTLGPAPTRDQVEALTDHTGVQLEATDFALEWQDPEGRDMRRAKRGLREIAARVAPDVVHLNGFREALVPFAAPTLVVAHSCVRSWWRACRGSDPDEPRWATYIDNVQRGLCAADAWVAPTLAFREEIELLYAPPTKGRVIHNGIVPADRTQAEDKEPLVLAAGRVWDEAKNMSRLVGVAPRLAWPLFVAGDDGAPTDRVDAGGAARRANPLGRLSQGELWKWMNRASIFVAPAQYEPFGLGVLEAASMGCALVLSEIRSFRELWDGAAAFVNPEDQEQITSVINDLCAKADKRIELGRAAAERARRYSQSAMVDGYEQLYREMTARASARPLQPAASPLEAVG